MDEDGEATPVFDATSVEGIAAFDGSGIQITPTSSSGSATTVVGTALTFIAAVAAICVAFEVIV